MHEKYIGDGVYAYTDGYYIWLRTERVAREHLIALEPQVLVRLSLYEAWLRAAPRLVSDTSL